MRFRVKGEQRQQMGFLSDISATGVFIGTPRPLPRDTEIELVIEEGGATLRMEAIVARKVWVPPDLRLIGSPGFGARFVTADEAVNKLQGAPEQRCGPARIEGGVLTVDLGDNPAAVERQLQDLELGGVFVPTADPPALNEIVNIEFRTGEGDAAKVPARGRVVQRVEVGQSPQISPGIGVQIEDPESLLALLRPLLEG